MSLDAKRKEILEYAEDKLAEIREYNPDMLQEPVDVHNEIFNTDYFIIDRYEAIQWLGEDVFSCIATVRDYEKQNYGQSHIDISNPQYVVNMYVYVVGEELLYEELGF